MTAQASIPVNFTGQLAVAGEKTKYFGRNIVIPHQFGFIRANVDTGAVRWKVGIGYRNPIHPPSSLNPQEYVVGDQNQTVTQVLVNATWIVTDNLGNTDFTPYPAALVWKNDGDCTFHGFISKKSGYWWSKKSGARILGDRIFVPNDSMSYDEADVRVLEWVRAKTTPPSVPVQVDIDGYTYAVTNPQNNAKNYVLVRSGVGTEPPPVEPPPVDPPPTEPPPLTLEQRVTRLEARVTRLEGFHQ